MLLCPIVFRLPLVHPVIGLKVFDDGQLRFVIAIHAATRALVGGPWRWYVIGMSTFAVDRLAADLASELERKFFWWEPVSSQPRSDLRIFAQAMNFASFEDVLRLETALGKDYLIEVMLRAEPGWIDERSWDFWRGRLALATGRAIPETPPRRSFDGRVF